MLSTGNVKTIRLLFGLKQIELAEKSGLSFSLISAIEREERRITVQTEKRIRQALNISDEMIQNINFLQAGMRAN